MAYDYYGHYDYGHDGYKDPYGHKDYHGHKDIDWGAKVYNLYKNYADSSIHGYVKLHGNQAKAVANSDAFGDDTLSLTATNTVTAPFYSGSNSESIAATS
jgi:hypothetical protein